MSIKIGDFVRIACPISKYNGITGEIFAIQESSGYAVVDMPKGTEFALERIGKNKITEQTDEKQDKPGKAPPRRRSAMVSHPLACGPQGIRIRSAGQ